MSNLKVLVMVPYLKGTGGTETVIKNLRMAYQDSINNNLYNIKLISFGGSKKGLWTKNWNKKVYNFTNIRLVQIFFYIFLMPFLILKTLYQEKPNAIVCTNPIIWQIAYFVRQIFPLHFRIFGWYHYSLKQKKLSVNAVKRCDHFFAISTGIANQLIKLGLKKSQITILPNPVIFDSPQKLISRTEDSISKNKAAELLYVGRIDFNGQKNLQELFNSLKNVTGNWHLTLYGTCSEKDKKELINIARNFKFKDKIDFVGYTSNVWDSVELADSLILTSRYEGFPMILCEAISHGIFCVASNCETGPSDIIDKNNGILYRPGDTKQLSQKLNMLVQRSFKIPESRLVSRTMIKFDKSHFISTFEKALGII